MPVIKFASFPAPTRRLRSLLSGLKPYKPYPVPREDEYASDGGPWAFLSDIAEVPHYGVIAAYARMAAPAGSVLDVGCGEGILERHIDGQCDYLGIDLSAEAVGRARESIGDISRRSVEVADALTFRPQQVYDVIVFNECLYYLEDPVAVVREYEKAVDVQGCFIISMYEAPTTMRVWKALDAYREPRDWVKISNRRGSWEVRIYGV